MLKQFVKVTAFAGLLFSMSFSQAADPDYFSPEWMNDFKDAWNKNSEITETLGKIDFNSTIAYGFKDDDKPLGVIVVKDGIVTTAGAYNDEELNWDLRAPKETWKEWLEAENGPTKTQLFRPAWLGGKLKFQKGNYSAMLKNPSMMGPFVKSFTVMGQVK
ncbi:SCP-2 sterol transfer family protein [Candidatus Marithrix sp. Canyon 246]|uniref:SCP-2 sterol transfer family protein n=1 Tax=Candidatus Marithrix sp. Canyon 246 TaxID=1827136 RepID=UPI00209BA475|nr:SCP-2 sterol transfer family protein [Candidatus Marithrix sp. Canyon 246]